MKKIILLASCVLIVLLNTGCTSKYQTNKLPNEEQVVLPQEQKENKYYLNDEVREDFRKYVIDEFNNGIDDTKVKTVVTNKNVNTDKSVLPKSIWTNGYDIDRKRY